MTIARRLLLGAAATTFAIGRSRAAEPLTIALATPMTGSSGAMGLNGNRGADVAVAEINAAGGIDGRPVRFEVFDDRGTPRDAATVAQRIADDEDKYFAVCGHVNSSATLAAMPIYSDAGTPVLCPSSSNPSITEQGWTDFIRLTGRDDYGAQEYSGFMINNLKKRKLGIFFVNNDFGRGLRNEIVKAVDVLHGQIAAEGTFTPNVDRDFQGDDHTDEVGRRRRPDADDRIYRGRAFPCAVQGPRLHRPPGRRARFEPLRQVYRTLTWRGRGDLCARCL